MGADGDSVGAAGDSVEIHWVRLDIQFVRLEISFGWRFTSDHDQQILIISVLSLPSSPEYP